eukprot:4896055-Pleurochrysis_carterae.AAC.6
MPAPPPLWQRRAMSLEAQRARQRRPSAHVPGDEQTPREHDGHACHVLALPRRDVPARVLPRLQRHGEGEQPVPWQIGRERQLRDEAHRLREGRELGHGERAQEGLLAEAQHDAAAEWGHRRRHERIAPQPEAAEAVAARERQRGGERPRARTSPLMHRAPVEQDVECRSALCVVGLHVRFKFDCLAEDGHACVGKRRKHGVARAQELCYLEHVLVGAFAVVHTGCTQ